MLASRLAPAVVVTDYAMTCHESAVLRTGWDLAERMGGHAQTRHIPVVFVTGFDDELRARLKRTAFARRPEHLMKPVDPRALIARIERLVRPAAGAPVRVLMADDDPTVGAYVRTVLPKERFHIELAANGDECLQILREQPLGFDILLLDLMMPVRLLKQGVVVEVLTKTSVHDSPSLLPHILAWHLEREGPGSPSPAPEREAA